MTERILVVDDDEEICYFMEKTLNAEGYETESVQSAKEAIQLVRENRFNLVVLDNKLPDVEGIDLLTQLREIDSDLDIIIITAFASLETAIRALDNGAASYIVKPLDLREILPKVVGVLEKQRLVREKKLVEQALKESGEKYRSLFENLPVGLAYHRIVFNDKGQPEDYEFLDVNEHFEALTGLDRTDILGKPASEVLAVLGKQEWIERFNTVAQTGVRTRFDQYSEIMGRWFSVTAYCPENEFLVAAFTDMTERKRGEKELKLEGERLQALWELNQMGETSTDSLIEFAREQAVKLTGSKIGYVAFLNEDQSLFLRKSWSHAAMKECEVPREKTVFPVSETGLWGAPIRRGKPVIVNDYAAPNPLKNGFPEGHIEVSRLMSIPVFDRDKIVATAGVANKESDYSSNDARQMTLLMQGMWTILQRRETDKALKESEEQFRRVFQDAGIGIVLVGPDDCILASNRAMQEMIGYSSDELSQMQIQDLSHPEDMKVDHDTKLHTAEKNLDRYQIEKRYIRKNGDVMWGRLTVSFIRDPAGVEQLLVGMVEDINDTKSAEKALRESEERFRSVFNQSPIGINVFDAEGLLVGANQACLDIYGVTDVEDLQGFKLFDDPNLTSDIKERIRAGDIIRIEMEFDFDEITRSGIYKTSRAGKIFTSPVFAPMGIDESGHPTGYIVQMQDITNRKRAEKQSEREIERTRLLLELYLQAPGFSEKELYDYVLKKAVELTGSTIGFFHQVSDDQQTIALSTWNSEALKNCTAEYDSHYPVEDAGNWVECIRQKKPVVYNDFPNSPNQKGLPAGHTSIGRFMSIPVIEDDKIHYIFGVGNKPDDYGDFDIDQIQLIAKELSNIIRQRRAEKDVRASEERFRSLFENAQVGIFRTSVNDGTVIECNEIGARILGYNNPDEVKAEYIASEHYVDPTSRPKMLDLLAKEGKFENFQAQLTKRDGSPIWLEYSARLFTNEGYLETVIQDISERKQTQEDLEKAAKKYRNLVEESMQGVAVYQDERLVYVNPAFATTLGYTVEELIQLSPEDVQRLIHHEDRETMMKRFDSLEAGLHFLPRKIFRYLNKTGAIRWVESYSRKTEHDGKNAIQIVAIDITERRLAEERMRTSAETANLHVDLMSHDIRNHLQAIIMATDILTHYETIPDVDQTLEIIVDSVKKSQTLIRKITATRDLFSVPLEEISLKEILDVSLHRFRESYQDVKIHVEYAINESTIMADQFLENMLLNLLENAVIHNDNQVKRLWIVLKETNEGFEVSISDNGPGIDESKKEALFDPGRRFGGVGLHQALRIAEKYLGKISVHDRASDPGQGAEFRVWIPRSLSSTENLR